jgi:hypothetical protein
MSGPSNVPPVIGMMIRAPRAVSPGRDTSPSMTISSNTNWSVGASCAAVGAANARAAVASAACQIFMDPPKIVP